MEQAQKTKRGIFLVGELLEKENAVFFLLVLALPMDYMPTLLLSSVHCHTVVIET